MYDESMLQAEHYVDLRKYEQALTYINEALSDNPHDGRALYLRALCLTNKKEYNEALVACKDACEVGYKLDDVHELFAIIYMIIDDFEKAEEHLLESLRINPNNASATARYSILMYESGNFEKGRALMAEALKIDPLDDTVLKFSMLLYKNSDYDFSNYADNADDEYNKLINMGNHFVARKKLKEAKECFSQAFQMNPTNEELLAMLDNIEMELSPMYFPLRLYWVIQPIVFWVGVACILFFIFVFGFTKVAIILAIILAIFALYSWLAKPLYKRLHRE